MEWNSKLTWKIFSILCGTYLLVAAGLIMLTGEDFIDALGDLSPLNLIADIAYTITDALGNHFNLYAWMGAAYNPVGIVSSIALAYLLAVIGATIHATKPEQVKEFFLGKSAVWIAIGISIISIIIDAVTTTCTMLCDTEAGWPLPIFTFSDYFIPPNVVFLLVDIAFWYLVICAAYHAYKKYKAKQASSSSGQQS